MPPPLGYISGAKGVFFTRDPPKAEKSKGSPFTFEKASYFKDLEIRIPPPFGVHLGAKGGILNWNTIDAFCVSQPVTFQ